MGKKLYVGNLSYTVTSASLEEMFAPFGTVRSAQVIEDRESGRSIVLERPSLLGDARATLSWRAWRFRWSAQPRANARCPPTCLL